MAKVILCRPMQLPEDQWEEAADKATRENPTNRPRLDGLRARGLMPDRKSIAVSTTRYWRGGGVDLTVGFMDNPEPALRRKIIEHLNAWSKTASVRFRETRGLAQVRIARIENDPKWDGYWSYVGTDILPIKPNRPTMNLEGFTMRTSDAEFARVVRHEAGHTLGCEHEHVRRALVERIDREKAYKFFLTTNGWNRAMVDAQVLTPVEEVALLGTPKADETSIMCYQLPAEIMKSGKPIPGGLDINGTDFKFMAKVYPKKAAPSKPKPKKRAKKASKAKKKGKNANARARPVRKRRSRSRS